MKAKNKNPRKILSLIISLLIVSGFILFILYLHSLELFSGEQIPAVDISPEAMTMADTAASPQNETEQYMLETEPISELSSEVEISTDDDSWRLILVNKWNPLPSNYEVELMELSNGHAIDRRIYPALQEMFDTARSHGIYPVVVSGYRTAEKQQALLDEKIAAYLAEGHSAEDADTKAKAWVAVPGTSEHQLGIAVDINADINYSSDQEVYDWLADNSYKFGFIRRYSASKTELTGVIDEAWHFRYVGVAAATEMYNQDLCLEEYLAH